MFSNVRISFFEQAGAHIDTERTDFYRWGGDCHKPNVDGRDQVPCTLPIPGFPISGALFIVSLFSTAHGVTKVMPVEGDSGQTRDRTRVSLYPSKDVLTAALPSP